MKRPLVQEDHKEPKDERRCIVVGSGGQDGRILVERMRSEGHSVVGIARRSSTLLPGNAHERTGRGHSTEAESLPPVDILDAAAVEKLIAGVSPQEVYYLAAFHHSAEQKMDSTRELFERSFAVHVAGLLNFLEAIRLHSPHTRIFYASSARIFGVPRDVPQDETTPVNPDCVYGISKAAGQRCVRFYRDVHGLFAASGILYNHESPSRPPTFVTQKIVRGAVAVKAERQSTLTLGDLDAVVDWGYAPDYVDAMIRILAANEAEDFVIATGEPHTVREFAETAFGLVGLDWQRHVEVAQGIVYRPRRSLIGNPARLTAATGWRPAVSFPELVRLLVEAETLRLQTADFPEQPSDKAAKSATGSGHAQS
jgi:GDPmannose 4,6-dehydratase